MGDVVIRKEEVAKKLSLVVLTCDDPHHFYLLEQLSNHFLLEGIVIETNDAQMERLLERKKYRLWIYRKYHSHRRKWMGHAGIRRNFFRLERPADLGNVPVLYPAHINARSVSAFLEKHQPDLTICAGTMFIGKKVRAASRYLINIHGGILPEYKGNQCIFFAFYEKQYSKIGATLHLINGQLDGGPVISRIPIEVEPDDNDESLYCKAFLRSTEQLIELIQAFDRGESIHAYQQEPSNKTTYSHMDRTPWVEFRHWLQNLKTRRPEVVK